MTRTPLRGALSAPIDTGTAQLRSDGTRLTLLLDGVESSSIDTVRPERLEFEYMQQMDAALGCVLGARTPVEALHIGGAACALAWSWSLTRPGSRQVAVEIDARLAALVREWFDLPRSPALRIRVGDGRAVLDSLRPASRDVIVRDAFSAGEVPLPLVTTEAARRAREVLRPGGLYLLNCAHGGGSDARCDLAALSENFDTVVAALDPAVGRGGRRGNIVFIAQWGAGREDAIGPQLDLDELDRALRRLPIPARLWHGAELARWRAGTAPLHDAD